MKTKLIKLAKVLEVILIIGLSVVLPLALPEPTIATDMPDADPTISDIHGFRNLKDAGDVLIVGKYNIPYAVISDEPASDTYMIILQDSTGNQTGFTVPYAYFDFGYNTGVWSMYFTPTDNLTYGATYTIIIKQSPAYFTAPQTYSFTMEASDWCTATSQDDNQAQLYSAVVNMAEDMESQYTSYTLLESGLTGTVLYSPTGENYFRAAIPGLQILCPDLFLYQLIPYDTDYPTYTTNMSDNYTGRYVGTPFDPAPSGAQFGLTGGAIMAMAFSGPICLAFIVVSAKKFHTVNPGFLVAMLVIMTTYMMGWLPAAIFATIYQAAGIYIAYVFFYARG